MFLLDDLILVPLVVLPARGLLFILEKIDEYVDQELNDESAFQKRLLQLRLLYEMDELSEEEYRLKEKGLLEQLHAIRQRRLEDLEEEEEEEAEEEAEGSGGEGDE